MKAKAQRDQSQQERSLLALTLPQASGLAPAGRGKPQKGCKEGSHEISLIPLDPELGSPTLGPQEISLSVLAMHYYRITFFLFINFLLIHYFFIH